MSLVLIVFDFWVSVLLLWIVVELLVFDMIGYLVDYVVAGYFGFICLHFVDTLVWCLLLWVGLFGFIFGLVVDLLLLCLFAGFCYGVYLLFVDLGILLTCYALHFVNSSGLYIASMVCFTINLMRLIVCWLGYFIVCLLSGLFYGCGCLYLSIVLCVDLLILVCILWCGVSVGGWACGTYFCVGCCLLLSSRVCVVEIIFAWNYCWCFAWVLVGSCVYVVLFWVTCILMFVDYYIILIMFETYDCLTAMLLLRLLVDVVIVRACILCSWLLFTYMLTGG